MKKYTLINKKDTQPQIPNATQPRETDWEFAQDEPTHCEYVKYVEGVPLVNMVMQDLVAQRISVRCCRDIMHYLGDHDPNTRHKLEAVLAVEGERAGESANRLKL